MRVMENVKLNLNNVNLVLTAGLPKQLPGIMRTDFPQVAMCGRSNVGKSSLINKLLGRKKLARVSAEPGKTITVNCYDVDSKLYLVDLPGYGYAKRSFSEREKWQKLIDKYFSLDGPRLYLQLVDLKVGLTKDDLQMLDFLVQTELPFAIVATKSDKVNTTTRIKNIEALRSHPAIPDDVEIIPFSAQKGTGIDDVWRIIKEFAGFSEEAEGTEAENPDTQKEGNI